MQNTRGHARGGTHEYKRLVSILGHEASRVWWEMELPARKERYIETLESGVPLAVYEDKPLPDLDATVRVESREMRLPLKKVSAKEQELDRLEAELSKEVALLNELRASGADPGEIRPAAARLRPLESRRFVPEELWSYSA